MILNPLTVHTRMFAFFGTLLFLTLFCSVNSSPAISDVHGDQYFRQEYPSEGRQKRAWTDIQEAWKVILRGARLIMKDKDQRLYQKTGGYEQALRDFYMFDPIYVRRNGDEMFGQLGGLEIHLMKKRWQLGSKPELEAMLVLTGKQDVKMLKKYSPSRSIEYLPGGSQ